MNDDDLKVSPVESITGADMQIAGYTGHQYDWPTGTPGATRTSRPAAGDAGPDTLLDAIPPAPTDEARAAVDRAAERVEELRALSRELHFSTDPDTNRVVIEVRDLDGNLIKTIPPLKALDVMAGGEL